nr:hypothetical protein GCM10020185_35220 [Pseudomonas brassicacearum subsp. brassicacearum]
MKRSLSPASPTNRPRAWSTVAALLFSLLLAPAAAFADAQTPATTPATVPAAAQAPADPAAPVATPVATEPAQAVEADAPQMLEADNSLGMAHDLSPWGMYKNADIIVKNRDDRPGHRLDHHLDHLDCQRLRAAGCQASLAR